MRWYWTGTSMACVTRSFWAISRNFGTSDLVIRMVVPPTPTNFQITKTGTAYSFAWVLDPTVVDHYLIYVLGGEFAPDELIAETTENPFSYDIGLSLQGLQFAVSAVSTQGVEGEQAIATAP